MWGIRWEWAMGQQNELRASQVVSLVRLIADAAEVPRGKRAAFVLSGVRKIIGAVTAGSVTDRDFAPGARGDFAAVTLDGWDETATGAVRSAGLAGSAFHPGVRALMHACPMQPGALMTCTRAMLVDDRTWYASPYVQEYVLATQLGDGIFSSLRSSPPSVLQGLGFYRARGDRRFSEADRALVEMFHGQCASLLWPAPRTVAEIKRSRLPPRQQATLALLLEGLTDKDIAARLSISPLTVNQYNKAIFRRFGVQSRAALLAKFVSATLAEGP